MKNWIYIEDGQSVPAVIFGHSEVANPPIGYSTAQDATLIRSVLEPTCLFDLGSYRKWRIAAKEYIKDVLGGGSETAGFELLSPENKVFYAKNNIGNGNQRRLAIASDTERDRSCFDFLSLQEGIMYSYQKPAIKNKGGVWLKAIVFSRCDHIPVPAYGGINMPSVIFMMINITSQNATEISGSLLELYKTQGIDGFALGGAPLGISDFTEETAGTRYAPENGGGLRTNAALIQAVQDSINKGDGGISGFNGTASEQLSALANELLYIIQTGLPTYL